MNQSPEFSKLTTGFDQNGQSVMSSLPPPLTPEQIAADEARKSQDQSNWVDTLDIVDGVGFVLEAGGNVLSALADW